MHVKTPGGVKWVDSNEVSSKLPMLDSCQGSSKQASNEVSSKLWFGGRTFVPEMTLGESPVCLTPVGVKKVDSHEVSSKLWFGGRTFVPEMTLERV